ncbi:UNVERIFIED_CONTAM: hypothetical protein Sangu_1564400 [Sesamum angustifolium]|uniref:Uncharacterized protein n=1 Tax=Sesamum angustifolium TaxID=2727405 RepID=A0AAW2MR23_9LAMI
MRVKIVVLYQKEDIDMEYRKFCSDPRYNLIKIETLVIRNPHMPFLGTLCLLPTAKVVCFTSVDRTNDMAAPCAIRPMPRLGGILTRHILISLEPHILDWGCAQLGLCPMGNMAEHGRTYSCCPIILTPYTLPLRMCMKFEYIFLTIMLYGLSNPKCLIVV